MYIHKIPSLNFCLPGEGENTVMAGAEGIATPGTSASGSLASLSGHWAATKPAKPKAVLRTSGRRKAFNQRYGESRLFTRPLTLRKRKKCVALSIPEDSSTDDAISDEELDCKSRNIGSLFNEDQNKAILNKASPNLKVSS